MKLHYSVWNRTRLTGIGVFYLITFLRGIDALWPKYSRHIFRCLMGTILWCIMIVQCFGFSFEEVLFRNANMALICNSFKMSGLFLGLHSCSRSLPSIVTCFFAFQSTSFKSNLCIPIMSIAQNQAFHDSLIQKSLHNGILIISDLNIRYFIS